MSGGLLPVEATRVRPGTWRCRFEAAHPVFDGHFPCAPILPGVAHVALALEVLEREGGAPAFAIRRARFLRPMAPGEDIEITVVVESAGVARFELATSRGVASRGVLGLRDASS